MLFFKNETKLNLLSKHPIRFLPGSYNSNYVLVHVRGKKICRGLNTNQRAKDKDDEGSVHSRKGRERTSERKQSEANVVKKIISKTEKKGRTKLDRKIESEIKGVGQGEREREREER